MINRIPDYLKLFTENEPEIVPESKLLPEISRFCNIFPEVTGLKLVVEEQRSEGQLTFAWSVPKVTSYKVAIEPTSRSKISSLADTREFEGALSTLLNLLSDTKRQLRAREAELAAAVPVVSVEDDGMHLAERLHYVLRGAAELMQCFGAGLYMLDEATTSLKLRAYYGLSEKSLLRPPRILEESNADIEALAGHAVVIEDTQSRSHWQVPESCKSAICVPISSPTTILGTLWLYRDVAKDFTPQEQNLTEIIAGRLASDLDRAVLTQEVRNLRSSAAPLAKEEEADSVENWTEGRLGRVAPFIDGWDIADGVTTSKQVGDFCHWQVADQDRLHLAVGAAHGQTNKAMSSASFQASHAAHTQHDPKLGELFQQTNQSLWTSSIEGDEASLFHAILDPTCGRLQYAIAGGVFGFILRPHAWEPLLASRCKLGVDCDVKVDLHQQMLMPSDILVAFSGPNSDRGFEQEGRMNKIAEHLLRNTHLSAAELTECAEEQLKATGSPSDSLSVLIARRVDA